MCSSLTSILQLFTNYLCPATSIAPSQDPQAVYPPILSQNASRPSQFSLPIQNVYQSARTLPALPSNPPSTSQPFLGFSSLAAPSLPTQNANQARLASAAATIPRQQVARRGSRRQGPARAPPTLAHQPVRAKIENCLLETDPETIRVQVRVYPPTVRYLSALYLLQY
jgi:hypothetical protein